ncbi:uncharacterized protein EI97DRAFT_299962 [Westerdykella ornata]|uniref:Uncharacterized protein n=1 Tax=Westerdykella ornata TaxID=318751 RepID=A0A6A6JMA1_WESOR|nr:uncharacterized protein EI97DRAFT_299962 [Westerdykella ornata]KAF2277637.1 hypothetical protein EI97DRAFT_299962 [Westerdykella ornata]
MASNRRNNSGRTRCRCLCGQRGPLCLHAACELRHRLTCSNGDWAPKSWVCNVANIDPMTPIQQH